MQSTLYTRFRQLTQLDLFVMLSSSSVSAGLRLLTFALLVRWLDRNIFGEWVLFQTYYTLFDTVRTGFQSAFINYASGTEGAVFQRWAGAAWQIAIGITLAANALLWVGIYAANQVGYALGADQFLGWFGLLSLVTIPNTLSGWTLYAQERLRAMQSIGLAVQAFFLVLMTVAWWREQLTAAILYTSFVTANGLMAVWALMAGWSHWQAISTKAPVERRTLWQFGRYSIGTLMMSGLLRSSDTLFLGAWLGPSAVVVYHVPQRLIEMMEMPIRSTIMTSIPRMASLFMSGRAEFAAQFQRMAGRLWVVMLPCAIGCFVLADPLVVLLGGAEFAESAVLLRIFMVYMAFMPLERYAGVALDAIHRPRLNMLKMLAMLVVNTLGNLIALHLFHSTTGVAMGSVATFLGGVGLGFYWLRRELPLSLTGTIRSGLQWASQCIEQLRYGWAR
jgi:O-antigen/teichoic acid export membrane protein